MPHLGEPSISITHRDRANFLAGLFPDMSIRPYFQRGVPITWFLDGVAPIKNGGEWEIPEIVGVSPLDVINRAYEAYVVNQPIIKGRDGEFQVTDDHTITFGQKPHQRPFKE
jgi:hypothetical protein